MLFLQKEQLSDGASSHECFDDGRTLVDQDLRAAEAVLERTGQGAALVGVDDSSYEDGSWFQGATPLRLRVHLTMCHARRQSIFSCARPLRHAASLIHRTSMRSSAPSAWARSFLLLEQVLDQLDARAEPADHGHRF